MTLIQPGTSLAISLNDDYGGADPFSAGAERLCGLFDLIPARRGGRSDYYPTSQPRKMRPGTVGRFDPGRTTRTEAASALR